MTTYLALVGGWTLLVAGVGHLLRPGTLHWHLRGHDLLAPAAARAAVRVLPVLETVLGAGLLGAFLSPGAVLWRPLTAAAAALTTGYGCYLLALRRRGFAGACGCGPAYGDVGPYTIARALVLAGGTGMSSLVDPGASAALVASTGRPPLALAALVGAFLALVADTGWAHSRRAMARLQHELAWTGPRERER